MIVISDWEGWTNCKSRVKGQSVAVKRVIPHRLSRAFFQRDVLFVFVGLSFLGHHVGRLYGGNKNQI